jgi:hypothetical protein
MLQESTVEEAALEWFGEQTRCAHTLTPALSHGEREKGEHEAAFAWLRRAKPEMAPGEAAAERRVHRRNRSKSSISMDSGTDMSTMMTITTNAQAGR